jgi:hypothetical protein
VEDLVDPKTKILVEEQRKDLQRKDLQRNQDLVVDLAP